MSVGRANRLKKRYGLTPDDYNKLLEYQGFSCKICGKPWTFELPCVDHDHKTGNIRGLLCNACNALLGFAEDNTTILLKSIQYLKGRL